jgi:serine protease
MPADLVHCCCRHLEGRVLLELLRAAAEIGKPSNSRKLAPGTLRFTLLYKRKPRLAVERARLQRLLQASGFELFLVPPGDDPLVLVLQFPGVQRQQSTGYLLAAAGSLADALDLASCAPDADPGWREEDEFGRERPESIGGIVWGLCKSNAAPPPDPLWAVNMVRAPLAWQRFGVKGAGILVGQPDTGVAPHRELDGALNLAKGVDIITGSGPPTDPLSADMSSPGHGSATASVVSSRKAGVIVGTAPDAKVVPIRCVNGVILSSGVAVGAAIDHARRQGCDIVTMSLGGPFAYPSLGRSIERATASGMIVLAAAGNCVGIVVYPAWDSNVIAVSAVDDNGQPWKGASRGSKVDVSAPGENVYVARRTSPADANLGFVEPGQGTSFAVAMTAGCAALWLSHHGRAMVRAAAAAKGSTVQEMFRAAVRQTAWRPDGWDGGAMGAGIVDAEKLLALSLQDIDPAPIAPGDASHPAEALLGPGFDWRRHGVEAGFLAFDRRQRSDPRRLAAVEMPSAPRPTAGFALAVRKTGNAAGSALLLAVPNILTGPLTPEIGPHAALKLLARLPSGGGTEAGGGITESSARSFLEGVGGREVVDLVDQMETHVAGTAADTVESRALRAEIRRLAPGVISQFASGEVRSSADLTGMGRVVTEALIRLTGRPALRLVNGMVILDDPQLGDWAGDLAAPRNALKPLIDAVGRIDVSYDGVFQHVGTGTVVAPGVVMTNRHVMDAFAEQIPSAGARRYEMTAQASICFDEAAADPFRRFSLRRVIAAGPERIGAYADIAKLDMAFLEVETQNPSGGALPKAAPCRALPIVPGGQPTVATIGYPAKPNKAAMIDPQTGKVSGDMADALWRIYHNSYGVKYLSPGDVIQGTGGVSGDARGWVFTHDATTLAGNSGSSVILLDGSFPVCGLHFGGSPMRQNLAHGIDAVKRTAAADRLWLDGMWPL